MRLFENLSVDFLGKRRFFYFISATLILLGILSLVFKGLEFGIDFKGGSEIALEFDNPVDIANIRDDINKIGIGNVEIKTFGSSRGVLVRTELQEIPSALYPKVIQTIDGIIEKKSPGAQKTIIDSTISSVTFSFANPETADRITTQMFNAGFQATKLSEEANNTGVVIRVGIADWIKENLTEKISNNPFKVLKEERVGPKIGAELKRDALIAVALSLLVILIYLGFRFKFTFAVGAVAALFHDVMITLGLFSIFYGLIPGLNLEISVSVVAALLTLVGYSINDTVIVFDRVRETLKIHKTVSLEENMNRAINKTMSRTVITGLTTLMTVIVLMLLGGEVLRGFAFALFIGIIVGTYSSIFVASAFVLEYSERANQKVQF